MSDVTDFKSFKSPVPEGPPNWDDPQVVAQLREAARTRLFRNIPPFQPVEATEIQTTLPNNKVIRSIIPGINKREEVASRILASFFIGYKPGVILTEDEAHVTARSAIMIAEAFFQECEVLYKKAMDDMMARIKREEMAKYARQDSTI